MRFDGKLSRWNDERGFGFLTPSQGGQDIFVHVSSFPRDGQRPRLDESLSFEIELDNKGQKRAVSVRRSAGAQPGLRRPKEGRPARRARSFPVKLVMMVLLVAVGAYGYGQYSKRADAYPPAGTGEPLLHPAATQEPVPVLQPPSASFRCDGRQHCSQMTSCAEATFFLKNCPGVQMDGDGDGVPCEQQWCTSPFAN